MIATVPSVWPVGAAFAQKAARIMDVILHIGAHRTGTTTFQDYMRSHRETLAARGIGFWGPYRTRRGLFSGLIPGAAAARHRDLCRRAEGRIRLHLARARADGVRSLVVSDENMIGCARANLRARTLYPAIGERMARFARAFDGHLTRVVISPRAQDLYWSSMIAYGVARGLPLPGGAALDHIARQTRGWRDVITDLACALPPQVDIQVMPFEMFTGRSDALLRLGAGLDAPADGGLRWLNRAPDLPTLRRRLHERGQDATCLPDGTGRWHPFDAAACAALREVYADDIMWLTAGADGLATLTEDRTGTRAGNTLPPGAMTQGYRTHDRQESHLAQPR